MEGLGGKRKREGGRLGSSNCVLLYIISYLIFIQLFDKVSEGGRERGRETANKHEEIVPYLFSYV